MYGHIHIMKRHIIFTISLVSILTFSCTSPVDDGEPDDFEFRLTDFYPAWSPDGETIAYVHAGREPGSSGLYLIDADGSNKRQIFTSASIHTPTWSPDGKWIAFSHNAQIYKLHVGDGELEQLTFEGRNFHPAWSPDGEWITYRRSYAYPEKKDVQGIWKIQSDAANKKQLFRGNVGAPTWDIDENKVVFFRGVLNTSGQVIGDSLWVYDAEKEMLSTIFFKSGKNRFPRYSPDGGSIALSSRKPKGVYNIWLINSDGTDAKQLTSTSGYTCDWSPDGEWIVFADTRNESGRLWVMRKDGTDKQQITFESEEVMK